MAHSLRYHRLQLLDIYRRIERPIRHELEPNEVPGLTRSTRKIKLVKPAWRHLAHGESQVANLNGL